MSHETGRTWPSSHTPANTGDASIGNREIEEPSSPPQTAVNIHHIEEPPELPETILHKKAEFSPTRLNNDSDFIHYLPLYKAIIRGDWEKTKACFDKDRHAVTAKISENSNTALHIAVAARMTDKRRGTQFLRMLVEFMPRKALALKNINGETALHVAAAVGNTQAAKLLVIKNGELLFIPNNDGWLPLHTAARFGYRETIQYLLSETKDEKRSPFSVSDESRFQLLCLLLSAGLYGEVFDLIKRYPQLAKMKCHGQTLLGVIAGNPSAFPSGTSLSSGERFVYESIPAMFTNFLLQEPLGRVEENQTNSTNLVRFYHTAGQELIRGLWKLIEVSAGLVRFCHTAGQKLIGGLWKLIEVLVPQIKRIRERKQQHYEVLQLVKQLCHKATQLDYLRAAENLKHPLLLAAQLGIPEVVEEIIESFPYAILFHDDDNRNIFQLAVLNRRENVFNLIYQLPSLVGLVTSSRDIYGNSILHLAGLLAPRGQHLLVANPISRMEREIRWFMEVEKFVQPSYKEDVNFEGKTPITVFKEAHRDLAEEAETWFKGTRNSGSVVAALVATVAFSASITVPGGYNSTGYPIFSGKPAFIIFAASNTLSLITSTASLLLLLSSMISRSEDSNFLPPMSQNLILNLQLLLFSILCRLIAFLATVYLAFGEGAFFPFPMLYALLPLALYICYQFRSLFKTDLLSKWCKLPLSTQLT